MEFDKVNLHILWRETANRIAVLQGRVREGVDVDAAAEFARWLRFSGILKLLESAPDDERLPCKGVLLSKQVQALVSDCGEWYANHERANFKPPAQVPRSELEAITEQLAAMRRRSGEAFALYNRNNRRGFACPARHRRGRKNVTK